jgi:hypothetical protein
VIGIRFVWPPWPAYLTFLFVAVMVMALLRSGGFARIGQWGIPGLDAIGRRRVSGSEFTGWVAAMFIASIGAQWGDMVSWSSAGAPVLGHLVSHEAQSVVVMWRGQAAMMMVSFLLLFMNHAAPPASGVSGLHSGQK